MKNIELLESNYPIANGNYDTFQCRLPLDFFIVIPIDDPLTSFVEIMKGVNTSKYFDCSHRGDKGSNPNMILQVIKSFLKGTHLILNRKKYGTPGDYLQISRVFEYRHCNECLNKEKYKLITILINFSQK